MGAQNENEGVESLDNVVIKSPNDRRSYRILRLPNGLCAVLVHDPEIYPDKKLQEASGTVEDDDFDLKRRVKEDDAPTKKAAAAMCVRMGSFSDPSNAQGLAHFLEHMLFMGSSDFPDENEYDSYLSKHGGSCNAYTETEHTCYYFEVNRGYLNGALRRFSQFFISPLVKAESLEREILAVDSEFNKVLQSDSCRLEQLQCHTSFPSHPFNRFCWGNKKSLNDARENGVILREEVLKMYKENYHGGIMKLVVIGGESLDTLEEWVIELFSNVKEGHQSKMSTRYGTPIWKKGKLYRLEAVNDVHVLALSWPLPCLHKEYLKKPSNYISHLMGHEGRGSLFSYLKAKGWATSLSAGVGADGMRRSSIAFIFVMNIHLTDSGLEMVYEVIGAVYQYIKLLCQASPQEWIFKELQDIGNMDFRFAEEQPQETYAITLAENSLLYSKEHIIYGAYAFEQWEPKLIESLLSFFSPDNMRIDILSKAFNKQSRAILYEPWFGSPYVEEDVPLSLLEVWRSQSEIQPSLHLPLKNVFIPCDFSLRNADTTKPIANTNYPKCIIDSPLVKLWYKIDSTFNVPRANCFFLINLIDRCSSVKDYVLAELFIDLLNDELNEMVYQASVANLGSSLSIVNDSIGLMLYGFNEKLSILLSKILTVLTSFSPNIDRFEIIKEDMERSYRNANMNPLSHSSYLRSQMLRKIFWDVNDVLSCLVNISLSDLKAFIPNLLSQLHIEGLCHGNLSEDEAVNISNIFTNIFPVQPLLVELRRQVRILRLPIGANLIRSVRVKNKLEVNSVAELYFQIEQDSGIESTRLIAIIFLFNSIVREPCFNQLRTKEQLGYTVGCGPSITNRVLGFCFFVQSSKYSPLHLQGRIENFISDILQLLDDLDDESFENYRTALVAETLEKDPSLSDEAWRHWSQIMNKRYLFDMAKLLAEELKTIEKADVINWYKIYLRPPSPKCRRLSIHVWGCNTSMNEETLSVEQFGKVIDDVESFKRGSEFYPGLC